MRSRTHTRVCRPSRLLSTSSVGARSGCSLSGAFLIFSVLAPFGGAKRVQEGRERLMGMRQDRARILCVLARQPDDVKLPSLRNLLLWRTQPYILDTSRAINP